MEKAKTFYVYLFCFFVCCCATGQDHLGKRRELQRVYRSQVGVREHGGANRGDAINNYLASVGFSPGHAWCAAFVSWCFQKVNVPHPKSAWVPSYAVYRKMIYRRGQYQKKEPQPGDVFLIWFPELNRPAHMGFIDKWGIQWAITIEGNTNTDGSREGDGVYRKRRLHKQIWAVINFIDAP